MDKKALANFFNFFIWVDIYHLLKRDDLSAHLEVKKCLNISPLFQTIFTIFFGHYIEWISKIADCKKILYRCHALKIELWRMLSKWHLRCAARSSHFQWVQLLCLCLSALFKLLLRCCHCCCGKRLENLSNCMSLDVGRSCLLAW